MKNKRIYGLFLLVILVMTLLLPARSAQGADIIHQEIPVEVEGADSATPSLPTDSDAQTAPDEEASATPSSTGPEPSSPPEPEDTAGNTEDADEAGPTAAPAEAEESATPSEAPEVTAAAADEGSLVLLEDGVSAVVRDFDAFAKAIEEDNGILNVHLGADITLLRNRVVISSKKPEFTLSGLDPLTGKYHTVTEFKTTGLANIVLANGNTTTRKVTLENLNIVSQGSYYGLLGVEDGVRGVDYYVRNVDYTGRQFLYNLYGQVFFEGDNHITIEKSTAGVAGQEVAEILLVTVNGSLTIDHQSAYPLFRMNYGASALTVNGNLRINAPNLPAAYGVFQTADGDNALVLDIGAGGSMHVVANNRLFYDVANSLTVGENAAFYYEKTGGQRADAAIRLRKTLSVGEGATFEIYQAASGASYLFRFYAVPAAMSGGRMTFNSPKRVVLANEGDREMVYGSKAEEFFLTAGYLDYWTGATEEADYAFDRSGTADGGDITMDVVHKAGAPTSLSSNHAGITAAIFRLDTTVRKIAFGQMEEPASPESVLQFTGWIRGTDEAVPGFYMEDRPAEKGVEIRITPQEVSGYVAAGFALNGGEMLPLDRGEAVLIPQNDREQISLYYMEPVIDVSVPVKMIFTAFAGDEGAVSSPVMRFSNNAELAVDITLQGVKALDEEAERIALAAPDENGAGEGSLRLLLQPEDTERFQTIDITKNMEAAPMGTLEGLGNPAGAYLEFTLGGRYYGALDEAPLRPTYALEFAFTLHQEGE